MDQTRYIRVKTSKRCEVSGRSGPIYSIRLIRSMGSGQSTHHKGWGSQWHEPLIVYVSDRCDVPFSPTTPLFGHSKRLVALSIVHNYLPSSYSC